MNARIPLLKMNSMGKLFQPFIPTPKAGNAQKPVDVAKSHKLLLEVGVIRTSQNGIYHMLPLGVRVMSKLKSLVRKHLTSLGAQEVNIPFLIDAHVWTKSGKTLGPELFKFNDRHGKIHILSPTNEESVAALMASVSQISHRQLPILLFQISAKFRDELKPRCGLVRGREFIMNDMYSFDQNVDRASETYRKVSEVYDRVFKDLQVQHLRVEADPGEIGGLVSHEYHVRCDIGEDELLHCSACSRAYQSVEMHGGKCPACNGSVEKIMALEVGHTFLLGTKYTKPLGAVFQNERNSSECLVMSSYGLGLSRILGATVELFSSDTEIRWPSTITPYSVAIIPPKEGSKEESKIKDLPLEIYSRLSGEPSLSDDVILDDRKDLTIGRRVLLCRKTGIPFLVVLGSKAASDRPSVELIDVYNDKIELIAESELVEALKEKMAR